MCTARYTGIGQVFTHCYRPPTKLREGTVFTRVSFCSGGYGICGPMSFLVGVRVGIAYPLDTLPQEYRSPGYPTPGYPKLLPPERDMGPEIPLNPRNHKC